jgi:calcium-dependent protein kinase
MVPKLLERFDRDKDRRLSRDEWDALARRLLLRCRDNVVGGFRRETAFKLEKTAEYRSYQVFADRKLGEGAFGFVCKAKHQAGIDRVIKVMSKAGLGIPLAEVEREMFVLRSLDHPHVLRTFEAMEDADKFYLAMEPISGGELTRALKETPSGKNLGEDWVAAVLRQVLEAVGYCHSRGIVHKDLKPPNVLLASTSPPHVVVADFGLAEMFEDGLAMSRAGGTPVYVAPEVWQRHFGPKCDVWYCILSLSCVDADSALN